MHQAPAVVWKVARTRFQGVLLLLLGVFALGVHGAWWVHSGDWGLAQLGAAAAGTAAFLSAWRDWRRAPVGHLQWDGWAWSWSGPSGVVQAAAPVVAMDFQYLMLLRLDFPDHGRSWCWVVRAHEPVAWRSLRRALFAGAVAGTGLGAGSAPTPGSLIS